MVLAAFASGAEAAAADPNPPSIYSDRGAWPLYRQWNQAEVRHYASWIANIYRVKTEGTMPQRLAKLEDLLTDPEMNLLLDPAFLGEPSNPQLGRHTIAALHQVLDCGKLTITLTAYYAYRRGLPWMSTWIRSNDGSDVRTADYTYPTGTSSSFEYSSAHQFFVDVVHGFCTGNYRVEPDAPNAELSDTAPVAIEPEHLIPGTLYYLDGHVLILAHVDPYGEIFFLDATTSPTRDIYTHNSFNAVTGLTPKPGEDGPRDFAGCYRGFRMHRYPIAETNADGKVVRVRRRTDLEMLEFGYSTEQYALMQELVASQQIDDGGMVFTSFHDLIRKRMRSVETVDPVEMIEASARRLEAMARQRNEAVARAWREVQANGPIQFPENSRAENVFSRGGRWGAFSTAALDVFLRREYAQLTTNLNTLVRWHAFDPGYIDMSRLEHHMIWGQSGLAFALVGEKDRIFSETTVEFEDSRGARNTLSLRDLERRLFDLSFDPNHPPELRWGAPVDRVLASDAPQFATPVPSGPPVPMAEAYLAQTYYRSLVHRDVSESYLRGMFQEGFARPGTLDNMLARWLQRDPPPPLVPVYRSQTTSRHSGPAYEFGRL